MPGPKKVVVDIVGSAKGYTEATEQAIGATGKMDHVFDTVNKKLEPITKSGGLGGMLLGGAGLGAGMALFDTVTGALGGVGAELGHMSELASNQAESMDKVTVVFGDQATAIKRWADDSARSMGIATTAALESAGTFGNLFEGLGLTRQAAAGMSKDVVQLAADLGSFNNVDASEALDALQSGLLGEAEPMRRFGATLSEARVQAYAMSHGLAASKKEMTEAIKVQARFGVILEDTRNAQGNYALTAEGTANSQRTLNAEIENMETKVGAFVKGAGDVFLGWAANVVDVIDGPNGAAKTVADLANGMQAAFDKARQHAKDGEAAWVSWSDRLVTAQQHMDQAFGSLSQNQSDWLTQMGTGMVAAGEAVGIPIDQMGNLADRYQQMKAPIGAFEAAMRDMIQQAAKQTDFLTGTWGTIPGSASEAFGAIPLALDDALTVTEKGAREFGHTLNRMDFAVGHATSDMLTTMADVLDPWRQAWADMAAWAKDPFSEKKLGDWIEKKTNEAAQHAIDAAKNHHAAAAKRWQEIADAMKSPVLRAAVEMGTSIDDAIASILRAKHLGETLGPLGPGGNGETIQDTMPNHPQSWWDAHPNAAKRWGHKVTRHRDTTDNRPPDQGPNGSTSLMPDVSAAAMFDAPVDTGPAFSSARAVVNQTIHVNLHVNPWDDEAAMGRKVTRAIAAAAKQDGGVLLRAALRATA